jgi:HlyD family secretion protein
MTHPTTSDQAATGPQAADLQALLGEEAPARWWRRPTVWLGAGALLVVAAGLVYWQAQHQTAAAPVYVTEPVRKGKLTLSVAANGTLQPTRTVNIGSELSGTVVRVLVDVNDRVKKGQVLVELDTAKLADQVLRSRAALAAAEAQLRQSTATVKEAQAALARYEEVARLSGGKVPSASELDSARASLDRAVAAEASAGANVNSARAALSTDETNLSKASIRSPIDGVVLSRSVDPGNAVAASLQAVTLFSLAEDLTRLRLDVSVDEADVGVVQPGQAASFTVSAYPSRRYPAKITRVAYGSTKTDNVITYTTTMDVGNADLSLRPGMTAAATIVATERDGVLLVPNTALRFTPAQTGGTTAQAGGGIVSSLLPRMPQTGAAKKAGADAAKDGGAARTIWVLRDKQPTAMTVKTGISDGRVTEVSGPELSEGLPVITDQRSAGVAP